MSGTRLQIAHIQRYGTWLWLFCSLGLLSLSVIQSGFGFDTYWHAQTGLDLIRNGANPHLDQYSYTHPLEPIKSQPILFQLGLAALESSIGLEPAVQVIRGICGAFLLVAIALFCRQIDAGLLVAGLLSLAALFFFETRPLPRPELIDLIFVVFSFSLYHSISQEFSHRNLALVALLMLGWQLYHAAIIGYVIFFGAFVDTLLQHKQTIGSFIYRWLGWGLIVFLIGFINSDSHVLLDALFFSDTWLGIQEHLSTLNFLNGMGFIYSVWMIGAIATIWALALRRFGLAFVICVFVWASVDRVRMVSFAGLAIACSLALLAVDKTSEVAFENLKGSTQRILQGSSVLMIIVTVMGYLSLVEGNQKQRLTLPNDIAEYINLKDYSGRVFNDYDWGGHLIYHTSPAIKVFIDGRTNILYPESFFALHRLAIQGDTGAIEEVKSKYPPDYLVLRHGPRFHFTPWQFDMRAEYIGQHGALYSEDGQLQPLLDRLTFPMCLKSSDSSVFANSLAILQEQEGANQSLDSLVTALSQADPKQVATRYLELLNNHPSVEAHLIMLGHWALLHGAHQESLLAWSMAHDQFQLSPINLIYGAHAAALAENYAWSRSFLATLLIKYESRLTPLQIELAVRLSRHLSNEDASSPALKELIGQLDQDSTLSSSIDPENSDGLENFVIRDHCSSHLRQS